MFSPPPIIPVPTVSPVQEQVEDSSPRLLSHWILFSDSQSPAYEWQILVCVNDILSQQQELAETIFYRIKEILTYGFKHQWGLVNK